MFCSWNRKKIALGKYPVCASKTVYERIFGNFGVGFRSLHQSKVNFYVWFWIFCWRQFGGLGQKFQLTMGLTKTVRAQYNLGLVVDQSILRILFDPLSDVLHQHIYKGINRNKNLLGKGCTNPSGNPIDYFQ